MTARGNPAALSLGPGFLYLAPLGTTEPTDLTTSWAVVSAAWAALGYTDQGSEFDYQWNGDAVQVAEELDDVSTAATGRTASVQFALAQLTATNLQIAMNGGTITTGSGIVIFEPPDLGAEVRVMLGFQSEDSTERWIFRQGINTGQIQLQRQKGANKAMLATQFKLEKPATGSKLFKAILAAPQRQ